MSHSDPEFLALAALGEAGGTEADSAHLARCPDCQRELERLSRVVGLARGDGPVLLEPPPDAVWARIAAATEQTTAPGLGANRSREIPPEFPPAAPAVRPAAIAPVRSPGRRRRLVQAAAVLVAGVLIGIGGTAGVDQLTRPAASQVVAQVALRPLPQFPQWQQSAGTAVLRQVQAARQLTVTVSAPDRTGFYEVWLLGRDGTSMISLGELNTAHSGTFTLPAGVDLSFYSRVDISLQPFNGSPVHSAASVVRGALPASVTGK